MKWIVSCSIVGLALLSEACWSAGARQFCVTPADYGPLPLNRTVIFRARDVDWFGDCRAQLTGVSWSSSDTAIATGDSAKARLVIR